MTQTKHQQVIAHIESLPVGEKVSVRQLARELGVSEGTVYRAIKEAESQGFVTSIPKVGTLRIEKDKDRTIDSLTYYELNLLLEGRMLAGEARQDESPKSYCVAVREEDLDSSRIAPQTLVITSGNEAIVKRALEKKLPLLLADDYTLNAFSSILEKENDQVIIVTPYHIFETISIINKTIFERVKRRDLVMVSDIMSEKPHVLREKDTVADYFVLSEKSGHSRFPVVDETDALIGVVTASNLANQKPDTLIVDIMDRSPVAAKTDDLMSYLARLLVLQRVELVPVISVEGSLVGVVSRQDIIEALQSTQKQPQFGDTVDIIVLSGFKLTAREPKAEISGYTTEFMLDEVGEVSIGNLTMIASNAALVAIRMKENVICQAWQINVQVFEPIVKEVYLNSKVSLYGLKDGVYQAVVEMSSDGLLLAQATMLLLPVSK